MSELVTVGNYFDRMGAQIAQGVLSAEGIVSFVNAGDMAGMRSSLLTGAGGAWLVVRAEDAARASELLHASNDTTPDDTPAV